ncbi:hypothetical protein BC829DRAFT_492489 [Chytridium lagenaria]|nr:hypothetical protein BC829DRAFT_492489 [Chytridium lagenaria]
MVLRMSPHEPPLALAAEKSDNGQQKPTLNQPNVSNIQPKAGKKLTKWQEDRFRKPLDPALGPLGKTLLTHSTTYSHQENINAILSQQAAHLRGTVPPISFDPTHTHFIPSRIQTFFLVVQALSLTSPRRPSISRVPLHLCKRLLLAHIKAAISHPRIQTNLSHVPALTTPPVVSKSQASSIPHSHSTLSFIRPDYQNRTTGAHTTIPALSTYIYPAQSGVIAIPHSAFPKSSQHTSHSIAPANQGEFDPRSDPNQPFSPSTSGTTPQRGFTPPSHSTLSTLRLGHQTITSSAPTTIPGSPRTSTKLNAHHPNSTLCVSSMGIPSSFQPTSQSDHAATYRYLTSLRQYTYGAARRSGLAGFGCGKFNLQPRTFSREEVEKMCGKEEKKAGGTTGGKFKRKAGKAIRV